MLKAIVCDILAAELSELQSLQVLNVACNQLLSLPATISKMTNLTTLNVTNNKISQFPDGIIKPLIVCFPMYIFALGFL